MIRHTEASLRNASLLRLREAAKRLRLMAKKKREALLWHFVVAATLAVAMAASALLK